MGLFLDDEFKRVPNIGEALVTKHIQPQDATTPEELRRVANEMAIAKRSIYSPKSTQPLPPFLLQAGNVPMPSLAQKISSTPDNVGRVVEASSNAFPITDVAGSIYDIASQPVQLPIATAIEETIANLKRMNVAESEEEMAEVADMSVEEAAVKATPFPNLAREIMTLGIGMEGFQTGRLAGYKKQGDECKGKIDLLLSLTSHLPKLSAEDTPYELKQETQAKILEIHEQLKEKGIDIFPDMEIGAQLSKEQLAAANSLVNHHIEMQRTALQELFHTKINLAIQFLSMIGDTMKDIAKKDDRAKEKANQLPRG